VAPRRWLLFGIALASLVPMTWAGVLLAFSVPLGDAAVGVPEAGGADRAVVVPLSDPSQVETHVRGQEAALLAAGQSEGSFPSGATNVTLARALAYVAPNANGTYEPAVLTLTNVTTANGTANLTLEVASLAGGARGFLVLPAAGADAAFLPEADTLGQVAAFQSSLSLWLSFSLGLAGFLLPLMTLVLTHKGARRAGSPVAVCRECRAPMRAQSDFCVRCGAWTREA
jgi:hypothetical protein